MCRVKRVPRLGSASPSAWRCCRSACGRLYGFRERWSFLRARPDRSRRRREYGPGPHRHLGRPRCNRRTARPGPRRDPSRPRVRRPEVQLPRLGAGLGGLRVVLAATTRQNRPFRVPPVDRRARPCAPAPKCPAAAPKLRRTRTLEHQGYAGSGVGLPGPSRVPRLTRCGKAGIESVPRKRFDEMVRPARGGGNGAARRRTRPRTGRGPSHRPVRCALIPHQPLFGGRAPGQWDCRG
jgi:hypothetical protein